MSRDQPGHRLADQDSALLDEVRRAARQEQFLEVVSADEARARFSRHLDLRPLPAVEVALAEALGRVIAHDLASPNDVPPFDRANVDGFAVRAGDTTGATDAAPRRLMLNAEVLVCGRQPTLAVAPGTATAIATGGVVPRGADAVVMIEQTELIETAEGPAIDVRRAVAPGQFVSYAGSDISRGETLLRRGVLIGSREVGMLAACGLDRTAVVRRPRIAVLSTGDELVQPGEPLRPGGVYDSNGAILAAAIAEAGGEPVACGAFPDDEKSLEAAVRGALETCDMIVLSGGTSKGAGDLSHRIVSRLGEPGILVHGVALKPGKPLCLAVVDQKKPLVVLPGFPTSAIFTFHAFVAPVIRALAGLAPEAARTLSARIPVRIASELGRQEFVLVALVDGDDGPIAFPSGKGSGAVTAFSQADGFLQVDALQATVDAGTQATITLLGSAEAPDLVIVGSHCVALDRVLGALADQGLGARTLAVGSLGGVAAVSRGECDLAPVHLLDPATGLYNSHLVGPGLALVPGWRRMQGVVYRPGDRRFEGRAAEAAVAAAAADGDCLMVNRNAGAGTRVLIDQLLAGARPAGYGNQPRSHNAVAAAVAQGRADWGVAIEPVAKLYELGFLPLLPEHYDFLLNESRRDRPAVQAFLKALRDPEVRDRIRAAGMLPADD
jgi:putative molybdopterin biosynthesis protein